MSSHGPPQIEQLDLSYNLLDDAAASALATALRESGGAARLQRLWLGSNYLTDVAVVAIVRACSTRPAPAAHPCPRTCPRLRTRFRPRPPARQRPLPYPPPPPPIQPHALSLPARPPGPNPPSFACPPQAEALEAGATGGGAIELIELSLP